MRYSICFPLKVNNIISFGNSSRECDSFHLSPLLPPWLQIRKPGFDSRHYQKKKVVGLERGPLNLVSTAEELLDRKVAAPV
jgi:hypothetical protein